MRWKSRSRNVELFQAGSTDHIEDRSALQGTPRRFLFASSKMIQKTGS
jgi:hypothetical protein